MMSRSSGSWGGFSPEASPSRASSSPEGSRDRGSSSGREESTGLVDRTRSWIASGSGGSQSPLGRFSNSPSRSPSHSPSNPSSYHSDSIRSSSSQGQGGSPSERASPSGSIPKGSGSDRASPDPSSSAISISSTSEPFPSDLSDTSTVTRGMYSKAAGKQRATTPKPPRTRHEVAASVASALEDLKKRGPPKAPRTPKNLPTSVDKYLKSHRPAEAIKHATPPSQQRISESPVDVIRTSRDLAGRDEKVQSWSQAIQSRAPCDACVRSFLKRCESDVPPLRVDVACMVTTSGSFRCDRCIEKHHSPCVMGDPLIVGLIADLHFARAILRGIARGANPSLSIAQENKLSVSWVRLARTLMNLSANGPSGAPAFQKSVENPKYKGGSRGDKEKRWIKVPNESAIMEASVFRSQALANSHPLHLVQFGTANSMDDLQEKILRDLVNTRRGMPRLVPANNGFPAWHASV